MPDYDIYPDRVIGVDVCPLCMEPEQFELWRELAHSINRPSPEERSVCYDCTPSWRRKAGGLCQNKQIKYVWRKIWKLPQWREIVGTTTLQDADILATDDGPIGGYRFFPNDPAELTEKEAELCREMKEDGAKLRELEAYFGVPRWVIEKAIYREGK